METRKAWKHRIWNKWTKSKFKSHIIHENQTSTKRHPEKNKETARRETPDRNDVNEISVQWSPHTFTMFQIEIDKETLVRNRHQRSTVRRREVYEADVHQHRTSQAARGDVTAMKTRKERTSPKMKILSLRICSRPHVVPNQWKFEKFSRLYFGTTWGWKMKIS